jgi:MFS transporter, YQGE family, putative transporter
MLKMIFARIKIELGHFMVLSEDMRRLLLSYYFYLAAYPLFKVFTNTYLWRQGENLVLIVVYNLFYFLGLPLGFYLNGLLLKRISSSRLYALGSIIEGLVAIGVVFFSSLSVYSLLVYGLVSGIGAGIFWGNKNYITQKITKGANRLYYNALESVGDMIINILIPILTGFFIFLGQK